MAHRRLHPQWPLRPRRQGDRVGPRPLRRHLAGERAGADRGAGDPPRRRARDREDVRGGTEGVGGDLLLHVGEQPDVGGDPADAEHGDAGRREQGEGDAGAGGRLHPPAPPPPHPAGDARHHVPLRRPVGGRGAAEPQRHEPGRQPVARVLLLCPRAAEHLPQDVGRPAGERRGGAGRAAAPRQGQLAGPARQVHQRRRGRRGQGGHVRQELVLS